MTSFEKNWYIRYTVEALSEKNTWIEKVNHFERVRKILNTHHLRYSHTINRHFLQIQDTTWQILYIMFDPSKWMDNVAKRTNNRVHNERTNEWTDEQTNRLMNGRTDGRTGSKEGWCIKSPRKSFSFHCWTKKFYNRHSWSILYITFGNDMISP